MGQAQLTIAMWSRGGYSICMERNNGVKQGPLRKLQKSELSRTDLAKCRDRVISMHTKWGTGAQYSVY